jgi:ankyrin repeat protein
MKRHRLLILIVSALAVPLLRAAEIHDAVESGDMAKVVALLGQTPALVSQKDKDGDQPLHLAAKRGETAIIKQLLEAGADVNAKGAKGWTPLHYAGASDDKEACLALLENGANRDALNQDSRKPEQTAKVFTKYVIQEYNPKMAGAGKLFTAIEAGEAEKVKALIAANPQIQSVSTLIRSFDRMQL